ncbi:MAG TPA: LysE family transporter [Spirochaetota bacterium]|mgnify:FL=1|jgi:threonine/homoserine/homoserine lactone efflux protein|nr:LysE family transporter [Spirochaetota bacterium]HPJ14378.1 LysE family transporter [Spirochaetota bacterium]HPW51756.1 LysE family transporter [Spirochaetota bacterium]HQA53368.1 LysE family transporter [Spirochaetota bacterium]
MHKTFFRGFKTGLILQLAIGPVFIFVMNIAVQRSLSEGIAAVAGVTAADYFYIALSVVGVGKLLENDRMKRALGFIAPAVLLLFGAYMLYSVFFTGSAENVIRNDPSSGFLSAFALTISSPLTILFWSGIFASRAVEYGLTRHELAVFAFAAGLATFVFLGCGVLILSSAAAVIPDTVISALNISVAVLLIGYGVLRMIRAFRKRM